MDISQIRLLTTRQATTFNLEQRSKTLPVKRGERRTLLEADGTGVITQFWMTFPGWFWQHWNPSAAISQSILKTLILRIYWDGSEKPAVCAPVGDFFGNGLCEVASFANHYFGMSSGGFFCKFPMPFRKGFRIEVENLDAAIDTDIFMNVLYQEDKQLSPEKGYLHARFSTGKDLQEHLPLCQVQGSGHYVGCTLSLQGQRLNELSFLEAPEYVSVDEDWDKPRITGTGLEDYFLGGWYFREGPFQGPFHGVVLKDTLRASVVMYRVHEADAIHFRHRFRFAFVHPWGKDRINPFFFSSVSFFYMTTPEGEEKGLFNAADLLGQYRVRDTDHQSIP